MGVKEGSEGGREGGVRGREGGVRGEECIRLSPHTCVFDAWISNLI